MATQSLRHAAYALFVAVKTVGSQRDTKVQQINFTISQVVQHSAAMTRVFVFHSGLILEMPLLRSSIVVAFFVAITCATFQINSLR